jgi:hypothetical protein
LKLFLVSIAPGAAIGGLGILLDSLTLETIGLVLIAIPVFLLALMGYL